MFILDWWNSLSFISQVFYLIAIPSTLLLLVQTAMTFLGLGGEGGDASDLPDDLSADLPDELDLPDADADGLFGSGDIESPADAGGGLDGLRLFTLQGIVAFFVVFGWLGAALDTMGIPLALTLLIAAVGGFGMMFLLAFLTRAVFRLRSDGTADNRNAIGVSGKVHLTIPPSRTGSGKVHILLQGSYTEREAVTDDNQPIPTGCEVVVIGLSGQTDLVVRRK
ncbi:MAG: hypothetical protein E7655_07640 [Ruminococcaceae bacterium]|nr:hypothetical protein [Oscillospiraceae bacterium]